MSIKPNKTIILFLSLFLINVCGGAVIALQARNSLDEYSIQRTKIISNLVKGMVSEILYVFYQDLYRYSNDCDAFLEHSKNTLLKVPYIRSINVSDGQYIYCSTITNNKRISIEQYRFVDSRINFLYMKESPLFSQVDVIALSLKTSGGHNILFGMHPHIIRSLLGAELNYFTPYLVINKNIITQYQSPYYAENPNPQVDSGYVKVGYNIEFENYVNYLLINYSTNYIVLLLTTIFTGILLFRFINSFDFMRISIALGIKRQQFMPFYQPIIDREGKLHGVEVLARWIDPRKGVISPAVFIPSAEKSGQINKIFTLLINQVIQDLKPHQQKLPARFHLAVNVSAPQLLTDSLFSDCHNVNHAMNNSDVNLILELTERVEIPFNDLYAQSINRLKSSGVQIALDDFGTGHSSLRYIKSLKIDLLKLDKSFIDMISEDDSEDHLVANVLDLAKRIKIPVVAEGIESKFQLDYLLEHNVEFYQGYYFAKPLPFDEFYERYLED